MPSWYICGNERYRGPVFAAAGSVYTGPGDTIVGADYAWWGLRGYSAASVGAGRNVVRLRRDAGSGGDDVQLDFTAGSDGTLNQTAISSWISAGGGTTATAVTLYDQTGNGRHLTQATGSRQPAFTISGASTGKPCLTCAAASLQGFATSALGANLTRTFTMSAFFKRTANPNQIPIIASTAPFGLFFYTSDNVMTYFGTQHTATATDNVWHAIQVIGDISNQNIKVDTTDNMVGSTDAGFSSGDTLTALSDFAGASSSLTGVVTELGLWTGDQTSFLGTLQSDQHTYWGV